MICKWNCRLFGQFIGIILISSLQLTNICAAQGPPGNGEPLGQVRRIQGLAIVQREGSPEFQPLAEKDPTFLDDMIGTDPAPEARLLWKGSQPVQADASLGTASTLQFVGFQRESGASQFAAQLGQGIGRFIKRLSKTTPPSSFAILTSTAVVAVIPTDEAADFFVEVLDENRTQITVNFGSVMVKNASDEIPQQQFLKSCQTVVVERDREPSGVMGVQAEVLQQLIERTTIPNTLSQRLGNCKRTPTPPPGPWYPEYPPESGVIMPYGPGVAPPPPEIVGPPPGIGIIPPPGIGFVPPPPGIGVVPSPPPPPTGVIPPPPPATTPTTAPPTGPPTTPPTSAPTQPTSAAPTTLPSGLATGTVTIIVPQRKQGPLEEGTATAVIGTGTKSGFMTGFVTGATATAKISKVEVGIFLPNDPSKPTATFTSITTATATGMKVPTGFSTVPVPTVSFTSTKALPSTTALPPAPPITRPAGSVVVTGTATFYVSRREGPTFVRNEIATGTATRFQTGTGAGLMRARTGTAPGVVGRPTVATLLGTRVPSVVPTWKPTAGPSLLGTAGLSRVPGVSTGTQLATVGHAGGGTATMIITATKSPMLPGQITGAIPPTHAPVSAPPLLPTQRTTAVKPTSGSGSTQLGAPTSLRYKPVTSLGVHTTLKPTWVGTPSKFPTAKLPAGQATAKPTMRYKPVTSLGVHTTPTVQPTKGTVRPTAPRLYTSSPTVRPTAPRPTQVSTGAKTGRTTGQIQQFQARTDIYRQQRQLHLQQQLQQPKIQQQPKFQQVQPTGTRGR
jgi:hypothetical protein